MGYPSKKIFLLLVTFCIFTSVNQAEDFFFKVIEEAPIWKHGTFTYSRSNADMIIPLGTIVRSDNYILSLGRIDGIYSYLDDIIYENSGWLINNSILIPANTEYLFDESFLTDPSDPNGEIWLMSFYQDILHSKDRNRIDLYYKSEIEHLQEIANKDEYARDWTNLATTYVEESLVITQSAIQFGHFLASSTLFIKTIEPFEEGYKITVFGDESFQEYTSNPEEFWDDLPAFRNKQDKTLTLILIPDGDYYMDIYMDTTENKIASVMKVDQNYLEQLRILFDPEIHYLDNGDNTVVDKEIDLSNITWPTRADGSMDYLIPSSVLLQNFIPTHKAKEELPLLSEDSLESTLVTTLPAQTPLRWIAKGTEGRIKILTPNGLEGWCSTEKLENLIEKAITYESIAVPNIPKPVQVEEADSKGEDDHVDLSTDKPKEYEGLSPANQRYLRILIVSLGIIVLMIVLLRLLRKKKS